MGRGYFFGRDVPVPDTDTVGAVRGTVWDGIWEGTENRTLHSTPCPRVVAGVQCTISRIFRRFCADCADCAEYRSSFLSRVISQYFFILHLSLDN